MTNKQQLDHIDTLCQSCSKGHYVETCLQDDWYGNLHCDQCKHQVKRYMDIDPSEQYRNPNGKQDNIFEKVDTWVWYQMDHIGNHRLLILNPTTGDMVGNWALYEDPAFNGPFMIFTAYWEEIVPTETLLSFRVAGTMSHKK